MNLKTVHLFLCILLVAFSTQAQDNNELLAKGMQYKKDLNYKEGLAVFQRLLKSDSSNAQYLQNASFFYCRYGKFMPENQQMSYYKIAEYLAIKSLKITNSDAEGHYVYALALGRINENASTKQKIANAIGGITNAVCRAGLQRT